VYTLQIVLTGVSAFLGGGVVKSLADGWNKRKADAEIAKAKLAAEAQKLALKLEETEHALDMRTEDTARHFLQELATDERKQHKDCLARLSVVEAAMFRQQYDHGKEKDRYEETIQRLTLENGRMRHEMAIMRDALLSLYNGERDKAKLLIDSLPPMRITSRMPAVTEVVQSGPDPRQSAPTHNIARKGP
jgi:hypothetical protein